jgi:hypothetical protein
MVSHDKIPRRKKIHFQPFATVDAAGVAGSKFEDVYYGIRSEYIRRFVCYLKSFLPELDHKLIIGYIENLLYPQTRIDMILKAYPIAKKLQDVIYLCTTDTTFKYETISSVSSYRTPLVVKKILTKPPIVVIKREEMLGLNKHRYLQEIKKLNIATFLEFPHGRIPTLFSDPVYAQNLLDTWLLRQARYLIFLAHAFDKKSRFGQLPRDMIRCLCSFLYVDEISIEEKK